MCSGSGKPTPSAFVRNLRQPMPLSRKMKLAIKNVTLKVVRVQTCCGHYGEPGC